MTTYYNQNEILLTMKTLIKGYLKESLSSKKLSEDFIDLIKHNFRAKFVFYNPKKNLIEIGVEDPNSKSDSYPEINILSFPISGENTWLDGSLKKDKNDMAYYGKLLNRKNPFLKDAEVVLL